MRAQEQVREQVSTFVQQRDELESRINVIYYHLFVGHVIVDHLLRSYAVCTHMYSIMEDLDLRPRFFSDKRYNHDTQMISSIKTEYLRTLTISQRNFGTKTICQ
ncbi:hypothetical protein Hanom_Chr01g00019541 [Helianthus anomalus]